MPRKKDISKLGEQVERAELSARLQRAKLLMATLARHAEPPAMRLVQPAMMGGGYDQGSAYNRPPAAGSGGVAWMHLSALTLDAMRRECQQLERNDSAVRALVKMHQALVVGDGAVVKSTTGNREWDARADELFNRWADGGDLELGGPDAAGRRGLWQMMKLVVKAWDTDGDVLLVRLGDAAGDAAGRLQLIESERVRSPGFGGLRAEAKGVVDGVERSASGQPVRYHVSDWSAWGTVRGTGTTTVDAAHAWLVANPGDDRVGMVRGEPGLQAMRASLERLNKYRERHALAAYIATLFGLIVKSDNPAGLQAGLEATDQNQPADGGPGSVALEAGGIFHANPNESVEQIKPESPNINYGDYVRFELMIAASDLGIPVSFAFMDVTGSSYITERAKGAISMRRFYDQQDVLRGVVRWVREWKLRQWIDLGLLPESQDLARCSVRFPDVPIFDFGSEVRALRAAVEANLITQDEACQVAGSRSFEEVIVARSNEVMRQRSLGVEPPPMMPGSYRPGEEPNRATVPDPGNIQDASRDQPTP